MKESVAGYTRLGLDSKKNLRTYIRRFFLLSNVRTYVRQCFATDKDLPGRNFSVAK